jgi:hypothetical protein
MLSKNEFWSIVNKAVELSKGDKDLQAQLMAETLVKYDDMSIASFRCISDKLINEIDTKPTFRTSIIKKVVFHYGISHQVNNFSSIII